VMTPGSEFRQIRHLAGLLASHPLWGQWEEGLNHGVTYPLEPYSDHDMKLDLAAQLERGNHQSAKASLGVLDKLNAEDIEHGYSFCLPVEALQTIDELAVAPHGVVHQGTINELGQLIMKDRPTHDQSFAARPGGKSINDQRVMELLTPCMFGHALLRIIHFILHLRTHFPQHRIFLQKVDFKSAYRRMHLSAGMAAKCVTVVRDLAYVSLRLPFGGRPCPSLWSNFLETITDLSNAIANDKSWDPEKLCSPLQHLIPKTVAEPDDVLSRPYQCPSKSQNWMGRTNQTFLSTTSFQWCLTMAKGASVAQQPPCWPSTPSVDLKQCASPLKETSSQPRRNSSLRASSRRSRQHWDGSLTPADS
jgi:hypothetical protein